MSLSDVISVKAHYTRSVNLERDQDSQAAVENYIPTSRALRTLDRVTDVIHTDQAPRAWSLIGPYGSGKSSFALFLSHLLHVEGAQAALARKVLRKTDAGLAKKLQKRVAGGFLRVLITGSPEPLTKRILASLESSAQEFYSSRKGKNPKVLAELRDLLDRDFVTVTEFMDALNKLSSTFKKSGLRGIVMVVDELGKFLEYEARHYGANDIYLLQALAEHACSDGEFNLLLFVLLHQSFEQYAKGLGETLKNEWGKVQGRFEEVPFLESSEQVLRVVSAVFERRLQSKQAKDVSDGVAKAVTKLDALGALPGILAKKDAQALFEGCYPLHPVAAMLLPPLCQRVAQNERTLFSYLGSHEENGLAQKLKEMEPGDFLEPAQIFDYFASNQTSMSGDYATHRRWVETLTAIERVGDATQNELSLLKTIGLFNIIGSKGAFKPSKEMLSLLFSSKATLDRALKSLQEKSVVNYRRFNSEYRVWQGSDFDLESALAGQVANLGDFPLAEELNKSERLTPIVARKYSIETGALRYFQPVFVDAQSYKRVPAKCEDPRVILFLALDESDKQEFSKIEGHFSKLDIVVQCATSEQLKDAVSEGIALRKVEASAPELRNDPIAMRELTDRRFIAEALEHDLVQDFLERPQSHIWRHVGKELPIRSKRDLQRQLSNVLESVYCLAPLIHNELINRDRPSVQANAARNKLLLAMQEFPNRPDLGIEKFPAEKAIYRAVLKETGIHVDGSDGLGEWKFVAPGENTSCISAAWQEIDDFLDSTEREPKSFIELNNRLMAPPFGVKAGLLPILYFAAFQVYQSELALYENRRYRPRFSEDMIERFIKRPDDFTVQRFKISGLRASIFSHYSKVIHGDTKERTLLELAKPLASFMGSLPEYTQKTRRGLSERAQRVRSTFNLSKSPELLLFEDLPTALGFGDLERLEEKDLEDFSQMLIEVLRELRDAHAKLIDKQKALLAQALNRDPEITLEELQAQAKQWYGLDTYTQDAKGLGAFLSRLTKVNSDTESWFENVLMFLGHKPSTKWLDSDQDAAEYRLNDFARRIVDLEKMRMLEKEKSTGMLGNIDFYLLRSVRKGGEFKDEVVAIDEKTANRIDSVKQKIQEAISELDSKELKLASLAQIVDEFLTQYSQDNERLRVIDGGKSDG